MIFAVLFLMVPAFADSELVVGQVVSLSRNGGDIGLALQAGQNLYFQHINASGGVNGKQIRLVSRDDQYIPEMTVKVTRELIKAEQPIALIGFRGTANALAMMKENLLGASGIPLVGIFSGAREIRSEPYLFHVRTTFDDEVDGICRVAKSLGHASIAAFYQDDAFGRSGLKGLEVAAEKYGIKIVAKASYEKAPERAEATLKDAVIKVTASNPEAVVLIAVADQTYSFVKQLRDKGYYSNIYSLSVADPNRATALIGKESARGLVFSEVFPFPYSDATPLVHEYTALRKKYAPDMPISYFSLEGFVNAKVLVEALKRAGPQPTRQKVHEALKRLGRFDLGGFAVEFTPDNRQGSRFTELTILNADGVLQR